MFENSHKIRVSARAIVFDGDRVLLNRFGDGAYHNFPGGGIEERESARMTVVREVREETGQEVTAGGFAFALEYEPWSGGHAYGDGHHISLFFRCELLGGSQIAKPELPDIDPTNPAMVSQPVWVPISDLPGIELLPHVNENLMQYFKTGIFEPLFIDEPYENKGFKRGDDK
ncbi:MAG: NUDIX domain-containing protein [Oscillospiraceae bacterium]|nr:NUDIX domain-containing protein [Oscillospiraceae bacterium]